MKNKSILFAVIMLVLLTFSVKSHSDELPCILHLSHNNEQESYSMKSLNACIKAGEYYKKYYNYSYQCELNS